LTGSVGSCGCFYKCNHDHVYDYDYVHVYDYVTRYVGAARRLF